MGLLKSFRLVLIERVWLKYMGVLLLVRMTKRNISLNKMRSRMKMMIQKNK